MMETKLVLLGTGTPNACPDASGPASAVVVGDRAYLVDFGPGVVRQASKAYYKGVDALRPDLLTVAFCTHLHTDHTMGYPDLIFTPWVLERDKPLQVFGPKGIRSMTEHILAAYAVDIDFRLHGFERANEVGYQVQATEIEPGIVYRDDRVEVEAFPVSHGTLEAYGYKFTTIDGKVIVVSGDTAPLEIVAQKARGGGHPAARGGVCRRDSQPGAEVAAVSPGGAHAEHRPSRGGAAGTAEAAGDLSPHLPHEHPGQPAEPAGRAAAALRRHPAGDQRRGIQRSGGKWGRFGCF